jgi:K(+)-stimulated pyrophosphate-energized sodium pump
LGGHSESASHGTSVINATVIEQPVVTGQEQSQEITVDRQKDANGNVKATVTISTFTSKEEIKTEEKVFEGTEAEVNAKISELKRKK